MRPLIRGGGSGEGAVTGAQTAVTGVLVGGRGSIAQVLLAGAGRATPVAGTALTHALGRETTVAGGTASVLPGPADLMVAAPQAIPPGPGGGSGAGSCGRARPRSVRGDLDGGHAHLEDRSEIVKSVWNDVEPATIAHCWVKSTILPAAMAVDVTALHGEYRV